MLLYVGKKKPHGKLINFKTKIETDNKLKSKKIGAEKIDYSSWFSKFIGIGILFVAIQKGIKADSISFINPNFVNLSLFGLAIFLHDNFNKFLNAVNKAIVSASGILIQFPLYFGIMGIMNSVGLVDVFSNFFVTIDCVKCFLSLKNSIILR